MRGLTRRLSPWVGGLIAMLVMGAVYWNVRNTSPGEISFVHARATKLAESGNCAVCHGSVVKSMMTACVECHADIQRQRIAKKGFHGILPQEITTECAACHAEHHGKKSSLVNRRSFSLAGVRDLTSFDHAGLDFHLTGTHLRLACKDCHKLAEVGVLPKGGKRFQGLDQKCASCHDDVHRGDFGSECGSCHGQSEPFCEVAEFVHTDVFALRGAHSKVACANCHDGDSAHSVAALYARRSQDQSPLAVRSCQTCHVSPHSEHFLVGVSQQLHVDSNGLCECCHQAEHETFNGSQATLDVNLHAVTGFPLDAPHDKVACAACHDGFGTNKIDIGGFLRAYPRRSPDDCQACHGDPHRGQFEGGAFSGGDCLACHERESFRPPSFSLDQHAKARFPLNGMHRNLDCHACHLTRDPTTEEIGGHIVTTVFRPTPAECRECHNDPHQGQFKQGAFANRDCSTCHNEDSFCHSMFTLTQHAQTRFPLTGAHRAVGCRACHTTPSEPSTAQAHQNAADGRIRARVFYGTPSECHICHADVHGGAFDRERCPDVVDGRRSCARCHTTESFAGLRTGLGDLDSSSFDHAKWTGYELRGAHARAQCIACHAGIREADSTVRSFGKVPGTNCQSCHRDPHVGQFGPRRRVDCSRCHSETGSFHDLVFDHQKDSRFHLDGDHVNLPCSACHRPHVVSGLTTAVRYKPLGIICGDCHVPRGPRRLGP